MSSNTQSSRIRVTIRKHPRIYCYRIYHFLSVVERHQSPWHAEGDSVSFSFLKYSVVESHRSTWEHAGHKHGTNQLQTSTVRTIFRVVEMKIMKCIWLFMISSRKINNNNYTACGKLKCISLDCCCWFFSSARAPNGPHTE